MLNQHLSEVESQTQQLFDMVPMEITDLKTHLLN